METVDLDYYVSVRKQFDAVNKDLEMLQMKQTNTISELNQSLKRGVSFNHIESDLSIEPESKNMYGNMFKKLWRNVITKNILLKKQRQLLVQVRFHEMRVHFIESHNLPHNFR